MHTELASCSQATSNTHSQAHCCNSKMKSSNLFGVKEHVIFTNRIACKLEILQLVRPNCISLAHDSENRQYGVPGTSQHSQFVTEFSLFGIERL